MTTQELYDSLTPEEALEILKKTYGIPFQHSFTHSELCYYMDLAFKAGKGEKGMIAPAWIREHRQKKNKEI